MKWSKPSGSTTPSSRSEVQVIALSRTITPPMRHQAISAGIDEVIIKPMSPRHLLRRVQARLRPRAIVSRPQRLSRPRPPQPRALQSPSPVPSRRQSDNVVPLFPQPLMVWNTRATARSAESRVDLMVSLSNTRSGTPMPVSRLRPREKVPEGSRSAQDGRRALPPLPTSRLTRFHTSSIESANCTARS